LVVTQDRPATFADVLRSEWTKLRTVRSTTYILLTVPILAVGFGAVASGGAGHGYAAMSAADQAKFDPTAISLLTGYLLTQVAIGILGALAVTSEYTTGMIRTSLAAVPRRNRLFAAKATVFGALALVVGEAAAFGAFLAGQPLLSANGAPHDTLTNPQVLRAVVGAGVYLALIGLLGMALGLLVRATAGAVTLLVAATIIVPYVLRPILPTALTNLWPTVAGAQIAVVKNSDALGRWLGFGAMVASVAALLAVALAVFRSRDA
jgi:hypothetical protein